MCAIRLSQFGPDEDGIIHSYKVGFCRICKFLFYHHKITNGQYELVQSV